MQVKVRYLDNLRLEASFDDFTIVADQPIRYKGDGTAPGPFDYFLASSAMCAAYFVKVYCNARDISTDDISIIQDNIVDPENRYKQSFRITAELPSSLSGKDRNGIIASMERCSVKRVIQNLPEFEVNAVDVLGGDSGLLFESENESSEKTMILGKDSSLEDTIKSMTQIIENLGIKIEIASWRNIVPHAWSVHVRDAESPICYTNGKGATKESALCSALGEYIERMSNNYFYNDYYLGEEIQKSSFVHYPTEKWFKLKEDDSLPEGLMDENMLSIYNASGELQGSHLVDTNSGDFERGICALPFERQSDKKSVYIPVNLIGNLFVSNGMSAGNNQFEARVQCLSEIFERAVKNKIITEEIALPDVPQNVLDKYPTIQEGIKKLEEQGFEIIVKDASLGGKFPVMNVTLMNPKTGGVFASFGSHPKFEVALERSLTELMQGRSFEGFNDMPQPTFNSQAVQEPNNIVEHFIDSVGVVSWKFFSEKYDFDFVDWNFEGSTKEEYDYLMSILNEMEKEVYIAEYEELGGKACRILVPGYSEIYQVEDLIWDNNNKALDFRDEILNIHNLSAEELVDFMDRLEESQLDDYMPITDLIGVVFDENTAWGRCTIGELKALGYIALGRMDEAKNFVESFLLYNDNTPARRRFFQVLDIVLSVLVNEELEIKDYESNLIRMYGKELTSAAIETTQGRIKFYGLTETNSQLDGLDKHKRLIESYKKLHNKRFQVLNGSNIASFSSKGTN